ncbi:MAG: transketolase [Clostridia bacterium]
MNINQKAINNLRVLTAAEITNAGSGHTGTSLGAATVLFTLFKDHLFFNPNCPNFENRDRFVLSAGHAAPLYYSLLHMFGFDVSCQDLKNLRKLGSKTPGHPELFVTPGVDCTTGPLGQGVGMAVGLAIAQKFQGKKFNTINMSLFDNWTYCFAGDGCLMEGVCQEAISLAGTLALDKLILLYDANETTLDAALAESNLENQILKFEAQNWNVFTVDGENSKAISRAISRAKKCGNKPSVIICKTKIGYGTPYEGTPEIHGKALSLEELKNFKQKFLIDADNFEVDIDVKNLCDLTIQKNLAKYETWQENFFLFEKSYPELFKVYHQFIEPKKIEFGKIAKTSFKESNMSGRDANHVVLNEIASRDSNIIGGSADLESSTKALIDGASYFSKNCFDGRNIHFGVREHAMGAISNGIALYSSFKPFCSTFLSFSNYMFPAIRLSAVMGLPVIYYFTHDGYRVGEDGPTHQSVEQITQLRAIPNNFVYRPADAVELCACYENAFANNLPSTFVLSRNNLPEIASSYLFAKKGGYVLESDLGEIDVEIFASGIEVSLALKVKAELNECGVKVKIVSMPCLEVFEKQPLVYKKSILAQNCKLKVAIECSNDNVWYKYIGSEGLFISASKFGLSGKGDAVYSKMGFNAKEISKKIKILLNL